MATIKYSKEEAEKVRPGVLNLMNVSVKEAGTSLGDMQYRRARKLLASFAKMVQEERLNPSPLSSTRMKGFIGDIRTLGVDGLSDSAITQIYNSFEADLRNVVAVAKADKRYDAAWRRLITELEMSTMELKELLGREPVVEQSYSWRYGNFAELLFAPLTVSDVWDRYSAADRDYHTHGLVTLDADTRSDLCDLFFGKDFRLPHLTAQLPADRGLITENFENATVSDLMTLEGVALNGSMLGSNGAITAAAVKKVKAQTKIASFGPQPGEWPLDRVELLCLTYFTLLDNKGKTDKTPIDIKRLARFAVDNMSRWIVGPIFGSFLPAMQGFLKSWTLTSQAPRTVRTVQEILKEAKEEWLDLSNFKMQLLCSQTEGNHNLFLKLFNEEGIRKAKLQRKADKERGTKNPREIKWWDEIGLKFAIHWIKYLCALGIVETAMDPAAKDIKDDPMEGMRYARLTALGRYALGLTSEYTPKSAEGSLEVDFDSRNGILTIDGESPYQMFLDRIAKRISPTRFRISMESLLKGCRDAAELDQRIDNLRTIIDPQKEPALQEIIDEAKKHTYCATRDGGYSLLRLRPDLPGLREAILTNKELREMTILAGATLALVKTHKMERFNTICASYGFLMD